MIYDILHLPFWFQDILDLFAGTGSLGLEALSRGAQSVTFIDNAKSAISCITENCELLGLSTSCKIVHADVFKMLHRLSGNLTRFDLILADPPYHKNFTSGILKLINDEALLKPNGMLVIEHSSRDIPDCEPDNIQLVKIKKLGETSISFYNNR